jgi:glycosyltransferase involved in cell wall biosynthesis
VHPPAHLRLRVLAGAFAPVMPSTLDRRNGQGIGAVINRRRTRPAATAWPTSAPRIMPSISAYIIAYNEAAKIEAAVASVLWADEVVVVDSHSTDDTATIARSLGARVVQVPFTGFGELRNRAIEACRHEWIFSLDSDERCTAAARDEILKIVAGPSPHDAYLMPRRSYMMGRWITGSGWHPNYRQPQLFRKGAMRYRPDAVHEGYELLTDSPLGKLNSEIHQFPFRNLEEVIRKMNRYSTLGVERLAHRRVSMWGALGHGIWSFVKHYVAKRGFKDGWAGFVIALGNFEGTFYRYAKRYEQAQDWQPPPSERLTREKN